MFLKQVISRFFNTKQQPEKKDAQSSLAQFLRDYFTFNKGERNGILVLIILIVLFSALTFSTRFFIKPPVRDTSGFQKELDAFLASEETGDDESADKLLANENAHPSQLPSGLFIFDPNTATESDFVRLGLTKKQAAVIINYRNKGGRFREKKDFARIYSINKSEYERLEGFILISEEHALTEINTADSLDLLEVKGIGPYIAMKILEQRERLGGFYSMEQLLEVHKIDSARYKAITPFLRVDPELVKKININRATLEDLDQHPYISYQVAGSLLKIRQQLGNFRNIDEIKKSHLVNADLYRKIAPYLTIE